MHKKLVAGLAGLGVDLSEELVRKELLFLDEMLRWNKRINLTSITKRAEALEKHLLDSLVLLNYLPRVGSLLDMGSGGGLPGIPVAIARPGLQVLSVDSVGKKVNFQRHIKRLLTLDNLRPVHSRLEDIESDFGFDFVVARALSDLPTLIELSAPLLGAEGQLLIMKGPEGGIELDTFLASEAAKDYCVKDCAEYQLPNSRSERQLIILIRKSH